MQTPCGHWYHAACLQQWLQEHPSCPMCRTQLDARRPRDWMYGAAVKLFEVCVSDVTRQVIVSGLVLSMAALAVYLIVQK